MRAEFYELDPLVLRRALDVLVARGQAQIFGDADQPGIKFF